MSEHRTADGYIYGETPNARFVRQQDEEFKKSRNMHPEQGHHSPSSYYWEPNYISRRNNEYHEEVQAHRRAPPAQEQNEYANRQLMLLEDSRIPPRRPINGSRKEQQLYELNQAYHGASFKQTIYKIMTFFRGVINLSAVNIIVGLSVLVLITATIKWTEDTITMTNNLEAESARNINQSWVDLTREVTPLMNSVMVGNYFNCIGRKSLEERRTDVEIRIENYANARDLKVHEIIQEQIDMCISRKQTSNGYMQLYKQDETFEHAYCIGRYLDLVFPSTPRELKNDLELYLGSSKNHWLADCSKSQLTVSQIYGNQTDYIRSIHTFTKHIGKCKEASVFDSSIFC